MLKERIIFRNDIINETKTILDFKNKEIDKVFMKNIWNQNINNAINQIKEKIKNSTNFSSENLKDDYLNILNYKKIKIRDGMQALRLCLTRKTSGPDLFKIIVILGIKESIKRIDKNLNVIND